jgi:signal transduction histidine kinase
MDITARKNSVYALQQEQELLRQSIELQERERQMIAYDIHDGIIQYAAGALMFLEGFKGRREGSSDSDEIELALIALRQALADGRRVMNGIRPPFLDDAGVVAAIEHLAGEKRPEAIKIEVVTDHGFGRLRPELESTLYRIAQEALFNAVKHSHSVKVQISLRRSDKSVLLTIRDWGVGFDPSKVSRGVHGLSGIQERARVVGGQSNIHSSPSEGTCISVELPLLESNERLVPQSV